MSSCLIDYKYFTFKGIRLASCFSSYYEHHGLTYIGSLLDAKSLGYYHYGDCEKFGLPLNENDYFEYFASDDMGDLGTLFYFVFKR